MVLRMDLPDARESVKWAVDHYGRDHVDSTGCVYIRPYGAGCLVGEALVHYAGTQGVFTLRAYLREVNEEPIADIIDVMQDDSIMIISTEAVDYLGIAQAEQDSQNTWGEAYDAAEASLHEAPLEVTA